MMKNKYSDQTNMNKKPSGDTLKRFSSKGIFPYQYAFTLLIPLRNIFLSPKQLIKRLGLKQGSVVLEVGPGPGYFSTRIAEKLSDGKLILADIQKEMLDKAKKRIDARGFTNVEYYLCDGKKFDLPDGSFDIIFLVTVIGEVENKEDYLKEFYRLLIKGGTLSISELSGDPDKMSISRIKELVAASGLVFDRMYGNEKNYTVNFRKDY
jgi:ubiquinone/menaquinone biosynthesis C-methylase UbiE